MQHAFVHEAYLDILDNLPSIIEEVYKEKQVNSKIENVIPRELEEKIKLDLTLTNRFMLRL